MKSRIVAALLAAGMLCISASAQANEFLSILGGGYGGGCGCNNVCGGEPTCGCQPRCHQRCCHQRCHRGCNTCGCDMAPACGCGA